MSMPKSFDDLSVSNMVVNVPLNTKIDLMSIISLIPLFYPPNRMTHKKKIELPEIASRELIQFSKDRKTDFGYCFPGDIIYAGYRSGDIVIKRGMIRSKKKPFKNAIELDIGSEQKFINCRLSLNSIHVCGAKSDEMIIFAVNHLLDKIKYIQSLIDRMKDNVEMTYATMNWISEKTKGEEKCFIKNTSIIVDRSKINNGRVINHQFDLKLNELHLLLGYILSKLDSSHTEVHQLLSYIYNLFETSKDASLIYQLTVIYESLAAFTFDQTTIPLRLMNQIQIFFQNVKDLVDYSRISPWYEEVETHICSICPNEYHTQNYPEGIDRELANYLISLMPDYIFHETYVKQLSWILTINRLYESELAINLLEYISINYNYNLGAELRLYRLIDEFRKLGIHAEQDNTSQHWLTVHIPYEIPEELKAFILKKQDKYVHTFIIYKGGSVTQSGPHPILNRVAFQTFITAFEQVKSVVCRSTVTVE